MFWFNLWQAVRSIKSCTAFPLDVGSQRAFDWSGVTHPRTDTCRSQCNSTFSAQARPALGFVPPRCFLSKLALLTITQLVLEVTHSCVVKTNVQRKRAQVCWEEGISGCGSALTPSFTLCRQSPWKDLCVCLQFSAEVLPIPLIKLLTPVKTGSV